MSINVRINRPSPVRIQGTTTFVGSASVQVRFEEIKSIANSAVILAQAAFDTANTKYSSSGGHIYGDVIVDNDLIVDNDILVRNGIYANTVYLPAQTIDAGSF
jgi:hypothetical protein